MSARKYQSAESLSPARASSRETRLTLAAQSVRIHKNGIEFRSPRPLDVWVEMTVELESPHTTRKLACSGIVVSCAGKSASGYMVSMIFTGMTPQSQAQLSFLAHS